MTYGLISDIHGNIEALDAALAQLGGVDSFLCMGDIVGYGPDPVACLDRIRGLPNLICVAGNHDLAAIGSYDLEWFNPHARAAVLWTADQLRDSDKSFIAALPLTAHVDTAVVVHGSLPEEMDYITSPAEARICFDAMPRDLAFIGHTHIAECYRERGRARSPRQMSLQTGGTVDLGKALRHIVNPGAIGQPRDGNPEAAFGLWEVERNAAEVRRVGYDIEAVQAKIRRAGLPEYLADRLGLGR